MNNKKILEARRLFQRAIDGDLRARAEVQETLTTSDFPILLNAAYGRELQQEYAAIAPVWNRFSSRVTVPDFRARTLVDLTGGKAGLDKVKEATEFPARKKTESSKSFSVEKYGARFPLTWEMLVNDDLGAFRTFPTDLATAARETEERVALKPLFNAAGTALSTAFFTGVAAPATGAGSALSATSLQAGLASISNRTDSDGRPIAMPEPVLMVPPSLEMTALQILNTTEVRTTSGSVERVQAGNGLQARPTLVVNPWLPVVAGGYDNVATTWFLLPNPSRASKRALVTGFLNGYETPDLRVKADAGNRVGGGAISPEEGAFDDDTIQYRVRHVTGGAALYNDAVYVAEGA
jgi:hypothetical protein